MGVPAAWLLCSLIMAVLFLNVHIMAHAQKFSQAQFLWSGTWGSWPFCPGARGLGPSVVFPSFVAVLVLMGHLLPLRSLLPVVSWLCMLAASNVDLLLEMEFVSTTPVDFPVWRWWRVTVGWPNVLLQELEVRGREVWADFYPKGLWSRKWRGRFGVWVSVKLKYCVTVSLCVLFWAGESLIVIRFS